MAAESMRLASVSAGRQRGQSGSALLESALCLTVFLMLIFGAIDLGRLVFAYNFVSFAAREGARYAMAHGNASKTPATSSTVQTVVQNQAVGLNSSAITVTTTWSPDENAGSTVSVKVQYAFTVIVPYFPTPSMNVQSTSQMVISQ